MAAEPASRGGLALRGVAAALAAVALAAGVFLALTLNVMDRQEYWCDDCPDLPDAVYASDDRYLAVVGAFAAAAIAASLVGLAVAVARRSRRALRVGIAAAAALGAVVVLATALHLVRY